MRYLIILLLFSYAAWGQVKTFTLLDTNVVVGQKYITHQIKFGLKSFPCRDSIMAESYNLLDSIFFFMNRNKNLIVLVGVNDDNDKFQICDNKVTQERAIKIVSYLVKKGIPVQRLISKGYGKTQMIISEEQIKKAETKEDKEALHALNRYVVLKIVDVLR